MAVVLKWLSNTGQQDASTTCLLPPATGMQRTPTLVAAACISDASSVGHAPTPVQLGQILELRLPRRLLYDTLPVP